MPPVPVPPTSRPPLEVRRRDQAEDGFIDSRLPGVEDIDEGHPDWLEWVEFINISLDGLGPDGLRGVGPIVFCDADGVVTVPRWYVDQYLARVLPA
jgi:hypothetical protein